MVSNFSIGGLDVDLIVGDVDKVNLIDFVIDYQDESQKKTSLFQSTPAFTMFTIRVIMNYLMKMLDNLPNCKFSIYGLVRKLNQMNL